MFRSSAARLVAPSRIFSPAAARHYSRITIIGRTGTAPELFTSAAGSPIIRYVVASDQSSRITNDDGTMSAKANWFRVSASARDMSDAQKARILNMPVGTQVLVEGEPRLNSYPIEGGAKNATAFTVLQRQLEILRRPFNSQQQQEDGSEAASGSV